MSDVTAVIGTSVVVAGAFFGGVAFLNSLTQQSVDRLRADVNNVRSDVNNIRLVVNNLRIDVNNMFQRMERRLALLSGVSLLTLGLVTYMAFAARLPTR